MRTNRNRPVAVCLGAFCSDLHCRGGPRADAQDRQGSRRAQLRRSEGLYGFSARDDKGNWSGFDVDLCRAIAAAIFNDAAR